MQWILENEMPGMEALRASHIPALGLAAALLASPAIASPIKEPPVFASSSGLLDVMIVAEARPVTSFAVGGAHPTGWFYTICPRPAEGASCPNNEKTARAYGGTRLALQPGDRLKIRLVNKLPAIAPGAIAYIKENPLLALNPTNLHMHGLVVAAGANAAPPSAIPTYGDFIFTSVFNPANGDPAKVDPGALGMIKTHGDVVPGGVVDYDIRIPADHPAGAYWFHPHVHGLALNQLSAGLSGIISIGNVAAYACANEACTQPIKESSLRHLIIKDMQVLGDHSGKFEEDPDFCANGPANAPAGNGVCPGDPKAYPGGQWFFTLNGQKYPSIRLGSPDGELWRLTNASGSASYNLQLTNDQTGAPIAVQIISIDGVAVEFPGGANAGQVVDFARNRIKLAKCGSSVSSDAGVSQAADLKETYAHAPVCATEIILMPASRVEIHVAYRDAKNALARPPRHATATLQSTGFNTGPGGDNWPAVKLANVSFAHGGPLALAEAIHVKSAANFGPGGIFSAPVPGAASAPLPPGCKPIATGHHRRIYFGNPNIAGVATPGEDADGNAVFGLGYEEIDEKGLPVPGSLQDLAQFDPSQLICLPLAAGQKPALETWELYNLTTELHNFHIHQTKFRKLDSKSTQSGVVEDTVPLPFAVPGAGSQPQLNAEATSCTIADFKASRCAVTPVVVEIPFAKLGKFVFHCHILEHEDGGMMRTIQVVPSSI